MNVFIMKGYTYILKCADGSYYTGSTKYLEERLAQHQSGEGAKHTSKRLPVELVYLEEFHRIDFAFNREKQIKNWTRAKKEALIKSRNEHLNQLAKCGNESHFSNSFIDNGIPIRLTVEPQSDSSREMIECAVYWLD